MKTLVIDDAYVDADEAAAWYDAREDGLGDDFNKKVLAAIRRVEMHAKYVTAPFRKWRKRIIRAEALGRFPYRVIFVDAPGVRIVIAVQHNRQRAYWLKRVPPA